MAAKSNGRVKARRKSPWIRRLKITAAFTMIVFLACFITVFGMFLAKLKEADEALLTPEFQDRMEAVSRPPTRILTADGVEIFRISAEHRLPIKDIEEIPLHVRQAVLAAEDKRFYDHPGVDSLGLMRAFFSIFKDGRVSQGGSTLTMQLAKQLYSGNERSLRRKIQDIAYAYAIEKYKTKDQVLLLYLNQVYFGNTAYGIRAAAKVYFNKDVKDLTVSDAALLARSIQLPSRYNPIKTPEIAMQNRDVVLKIMREEGFISEQQYQKALSEVPKLNPKPPTTTAFYSAGIAKHFVHHVLDTIERDMPDLDLKRGGYVIHATIDSKLQRHAEKMLRQRVREGRSRRINQGAFVAMDREGRILCEVGGTDFEKSEYNIITQGRRQPGSAFKAIVYSVGLMTGNIYGAEDMISNAVISKYDPWTRKTWRPQNSARWETASYYSAEKAFAYSINRPAIHLTERIGPRVVAQYAKDAFGIQSKLDPVLPLALGSSDVKPLELLEAYSVFMLGGDRVRPIPITKIVSPSGEIIKRYEAQRFVGVVSPAVVATMDRMMRAVVEYGTGKAAAIVPNSRGKTGTTNRAKDAWFCGYTDGLVGIGWVGNEQIINGVPHALPMANSVYGGTVTAHIWADIMKVAHDRFAKPLKAVDSKVAAAVPPVRQTDREFVDRIQDERPTSTSVREPVIPPTEIDREDSTPPPTNPPVNPPVVIDEAELERLAREAERKAEEERQRDLQRLLDAERRREEDRRRRSEGGRAQGIVTLDICADSGMVANRYCPEVVPTSFSRRSAPNRRCRIHGPD